MTPEQMRDRYERGWTLAELAAEVGRSITWVQVTLLKAGTPLRHRGRRKGVSGFPAGLHSDNRVFPHKAAIIGARKQGETLKAIGDRYGVTRERIRQALKEWSA